jgi:hypothetical protein
MWIAKKYMHILQIVERVKLEIENSVLLDDI